MSNIRKRRNGTVITRQHFNLKPSRLAGGTHFRFDSERLAQKKRAAYEAKMIDFLLSKRKLSHHHQQQSYDSDDDMDEVASEDEFESAFPISEALQDLMASGYESESDDDSDTELTKMEPTLPDVSSIWTTDKIDLIRRGIIKFMGRASKQTCMGPGDSGKGCHNPFQYQCRTCEHEPTFCDSCLHITHRSVSSVHKLSEHVSGRWRLTDLVVNYSLPTPSISSQPFRYKTLLAWTMSGSKTIGVDYMVPKGTSEVIALFERLLELGYVPATPAKPETVFSFHLLDTLVLLQQHCKINDTNFAQFLQAVDGKEHQQATFLSNLRTVGDIYRKLKVDIDDGTMLLALIKENMNDAADLSDFHTQDGCIACDRPSSTCLRRYAVDGNYGLAVLKRRMNGKNTSSASAEQIKPHFRDAMVLNGPHLDDMKEQVVMEQQTDSKPTAKQRTLPAKGIRNNLDNLGNDLDSDATPEQPVSKPAAKQTSQLSNTSIECTSRAGGELFKKYTGSQFANKERSGIVAAICDHMVVARGVFMQDSGESYFYAASILQLALGPVAGKLGTVDQQMRIILGYDINCKFLPYLKKRFPLISNIVQQGVIPVMHLYSHQMSCFEHFNPKFTSLAGDFVFEAIESFWSANDHLIPIIRRMGVQRAIDFVSFSWVQYNWTCTLNTMLRCLKSSQYAETNLAYFSKLKDSIKSKYSSEAVKAVLESKNIVQTDAKLTNEEHYFELLINSETAGLTEKPKAQELLVAFEKTGLAKREEFRRSNQVWAKGGSSYIAVGNIYFEKCFKAAQEVLKRCWGERKIMFVLLKRKVGTKTTGQIVKRNDQITSSLRTELNLYNELKTQEAIFRSQPIPAAITIADLDSGEHKVWKSVSITRDDGCIPVDVGFELKDACHRIERAKEELCWSNKALVNMQTWCNERRRALEVIDIAVAESSQSSSVKAASYLLLDIQVSKLDALESKIRKYGPLITKLHQKHITIDLLNPTIKTTGAPMDVL